ncbi:MAG: putative Ig domain-containing protein [Candidatus Woesearchaeota archaeon]|nr:putative Ig domain-containing protein [Candidatus Woesearchaeota archaeon]
MVLQRLNRKSFAMLLFVLFFLFSQIKLIKGEGNETAGNVTLSPIGNKEASENVTLSFTISAASSTNSLITYSFSSESPMGASIDSSTGFFNWTPLFNQSGNYTLSFNASDGTYSDNETIFINVSNVNRIPSLNPISNNSTDENKSITFYVNATDPDSDDTLTYSISGAPLGASINSSTGFFSWTPLFNQSGTYNVTFSVSDGMLSANETIAINVSNTNRAPAIDAIGNRNVEEESTLEFTVSASDPDGDSITYSASNIPSRAEFNSATRTFSWTPNLTQSGSYSVTFSASDGNSASSQIIITITVTNKCTPSWSCVWSTCINGYSEGTCTDANSCGTSSGKPSEGKSCPIIVATPSQRIAPSGASGNSAKINLNISCNESWICSPWSECNATGVMKRECVDRNMCGAKKDMPETIESCETAAENESMTGANIQKSEESNGTAGGFFSFVRNLFNRAEITGNAVKEESNDNNSKEGSLKGSVNAWAGLGAIIGNAISSTGVAAEKVKSSPVISAGAILILTLLAFGIIRGASAWKKKRRDKYWYKL